MLAVACALGSALMYALASVLQQRGASAQPQEHSMRLGLLVRLARDPGWVLGVVCDIAGYALQFIALGHGPIVLVQPLLVSGILFALPMGAAWSGRRLGRGDWLAALAVCAGLALFLTVSRPAEGRSDVSRLVWLALLASDSGVAVVLVGLSRTGGRRRKAFMLSGAAGVIYGAAAALTKTSSHLLNHGVGPVVTHWQPYVLLGFGVAGMVVGQSAFQAGALDVSLPAMSVLDPVVSIVIGALAFGEAVASSAGPLALEVIGLVVMSAGVIALARTEAAKSPSVVT